MRLRWALVAATVLAAACGDDTAPSAGPGADAVVVTPAIEPLSDAEVVALAGAAVWRVATEGCDWLGSGSAFAIDDRHLVTNRHVIANDTSPTVVSPSGEERSGRVIGASDEVDVAVIEVEDDLPVTLQWAPTDALQAGEHVVVLGYPAPDLTFTTTVGSIVNFQGRDGAREAMLTDAPIGPGNSGGPGLRADATVAGVVTQMTLDDPSERAAIVFSAASVAALVAGYIADPDDDVLSECGFGPDYVPPLPDHFDVPTPPPPPPATATTLPLPLPTVPRPTVTTPTTRPAPTTRPLPPTTTTTEPPCPSGSPSFELGPVSAEPGTEEGTWAVTTSIHVVNDSTESVTVQRADVTLLDAAGDATATIVVPFADNLFRSARVDRDVVEAVVAPEPPVSAAAVLTWSWREERYAACPVAPITAPPPEPGPVG